MNRKESELENPVNNDSSSPSSFSNSNQSEHFEMVGDILDNLPPDYEDYEYEYYDPIDEGLAADYEDEALPINSKNNGE